MCPQRPRSKKMQKGHRRAPKGNAETPRARCSSFPFRRPSFYLAGGGQRLKDKPQGTRWLGQLCYASPPQVPQTRQPCPLCSPSPEFPHLRLLLAATEVAACFPEARDTRGTSRGQRRELVAGPVGFSLPFPNRRACRCPAEPRRQAGRTLWTRPRVSPRCPAGGSARVAAVLSAAGFHSGPVPATSPTAAAGTGYRAPGWPGMRAAPATAWQPQVGSRRGAPGLPARAPAAGPRVSLAPPSQPEGLFFSLFLVVSAGILYSLRSFLRSLSQTSPPNFLSFRLAGL